MLFFGYKIKVTTQADIKLSKMSIFFTISMLRRYVFFRIPTKKIGFFFEKKIYFVSLPSKIFLFRDFFLRE